MSSAKSPSVAAYDIPERVASYDADMDLMHPYRHKMLVSMELFAVPPVVTNASTPNLPLANSSPISKPVITISRSRSRKI